MDSDLLLKKYGLKYEDLNADERQHFNNMLDAMSKGQLTFEKIRESLNSMLQSLLFEVSHYENGSKQDTWCKARIRNYILLIAFMETPEKAKKALERALGAVK